MIAPSTAQVQLKYPRTQQRSARGQVQQSLFRALIIGHLVRKGRNWTFLRFGSAQIGDQTIKER
jgi:hypothetical protein